MYNAKYIIPGVLIAVAAFTSPFWLNLGGKTYVYPEVALPRAKARTSASSPRNGCVPNNEIRR